MGVELVSDYKLDIDIPELGDGSSVDEAFRRIVLEMLSLCGDKLKDLAQALEGAEEAKLKKFEEALKAFLEHVEQQKKADKLSGIFKALGILGVVLAAIMTFFAPSPMSIAMLVVTIAMAFEPLIAQACGQPSLIQQALSKMAEAFQDTFGQIGGMVMSLLVTVLAMVALSTAAASGVSAASRFALSRVESLQTFRQAVIEIFESLTKNMNLTQKQLVAITRAMGAVEVTVMLGMAGTQGAAAGVKFEAAKLFEEFSIDQAVRDWWSHAIDLLQGDLSSEREWHNKLTEMTARIYPLEN